MKVVVVDVLTEGLGHCAVSFVGMHDRREYILLAANYLHGGFVDVSIEPLGKLVAAVVVEVRRVHVKHQLAIFHGVRFEATRGNGQRAIPLRLTSRPY